MHCNLNLDFCVGNYYYGCDEHFVDDCLWESGIVPVGTCDCIFACTPTEEYLDWCDENDYLMNEQCICGPSPILIDINGNGFHLTDAQDGVNFDINGNGVREDSRGLTLVQTTRG